ncbi:hypothetical protein JCM3765_007260 [Sporobolomyces pararoseus]
MRTPPLPSVERQETTQEREGAGPMKRNWFYSVPTQAVILGLVSFLGVGMYNALSGLGAGGLASATVWNQATAILFTFLCVTCVFAPIVINQFELRWTLSLASASYSLYAASLYCNSKSGNTWFLILANVLNGMGAGAYYAVEGAAVTGYPEANRRGRMIAIWVACRNMGPIVGGAILLGLNIKTNGTGSVSLDSYAAFVGITCAAPFIALLLAPAAKVQRKDGTKVVVRPTSWKIELKTSYRTLTSRKILLLVPLFFTSWWADSFISTYNATYLTVRSRALSSFLTPFAGNIASLATGTFLDSRLGTRRSRAKFALAFFFFLDLAMYAYSAANTAYYDSLDTPPKFDYTDSGFGRAYLHSFFRNFEELGIQSFLYFLMGTMTDDLHELVHLSGVLRGLEGAGQAVSYGIAGSGASKWVSIGLGFALVVVAYPCAYLVIREIEEKAPILSEDHKEGSLAGEEGSEKEKDSLGP